MLLLGYSRLMDEAWRVGDLHLFKSSDSPLELCIIDCLTVVIVLPLIIVSEM